MSSCDVAITGTTTQQPNHTTTYFLLPLSHYSATIKGMPATSILSLNIEGDNHLNRVTKLLQNKKPDIFCVQEIFKDDLHIFEQLLHVRAQFVPLFRVEFPNDFRLSTRGEWGIALFSKKNVASLSMHAYAGSLNHVPVCESDPNHTNRVVLVAKIGTDQQFFYVATTHFTWTNHGAVSELQHQHMDGMLKALWPYTPLVLTGDFNAPRGKSVFSRLANRYKDNIPPEITTTIDQKLHRSPGIQFVVDGLFTTPQLTVNHVEVIDSVSDHQAVFSIVETPL